MSKYIIAYCEQDNEKLKDHFIYGGEVTQEEYDQIKKNRFIYDKQINETVFVSKLKLLEIVKEDEISN